LDFFQWFIHRSNKPGLCERNPGSAKQPGRTGSQTCLAQTLKTITTTGLGFRGYCEDEINPEKNVKP
jgi:hypothetical protein